MKRKVLTGIVIAVVILAIIANVSMNVLASTMDTFLGGGKRTVTVSKEAEDWDTQYYKSEYATWQEAREHSYEVAERIAEEGIVLLKNNGVLPLRQGTRVMPFGYRYLKPIYGQLTSGGSAKWMVGNEITPEQGMEKYVTLDTAAVKKMQASGTPEPLREAAGTTPASGDSDVLGGDSLIYEYDAAIYAGMSTQKETTALVFLARAGQEGYDLKADAYEDGTPHYLALTQNEKATIQAAKEICGRVILVVESSAILELTPVMVGELEVDAILWVGHLGERGYSCLGCILTGETNPSGRTVDIFPADFTKDPTYVNNGDFHYSNAPAQIYGLGAGEVARAYLEYQEGIYMGYRFYETADMLGKLDYDEAVLFPFGYGLSYTAFEQEITDFRDDTDEIRVTVRVRNVGKLPGKEVVQLYYAAPYTDFDRENKIEKAACVLAAFDKTELIPAGGAAQITLSFAKKDMASYCYALQDGGYVLEKGEYQVSLRKDSHTVLDSRTVSINETQWLDGPKNLFPDSTAYMLRQSSILSRSDWEGTYPAQSGRSKEADARTLALFGLDNTFDWENDPVLGNGTFRGEQPVSNAHNGLSLINLRGKSYDDPLWEKLLDEINWENVNDILAKLCGCAYNSSRIDEIGLPSTVIEDGVTGIKVQGMDSGYDMTKTATYGMMPLLASTWNTALAREMGEALGQEGLMVGVQGLYGPAVNLHRSPFGGRVFEYFSEDPLLSGKMAAAEIGGAGDYGLICTLKHFALNDQEKNRSLLLSAWADEQTMRELYFRPFEIAVREAKSEISYIADEHGTAATKEIRACTGIMATQSNIGAVPGHANFALLTKLLREEWGFEGVVTTDYWFWAGTGRTGKLANSLRDAAFRAGADMYLCMGLPNVSVNDKQSAAALTAYRQNIKNIAYAVVNSAAMQGISAGTTVHYEMSPWRICLYGADVLVVILVAVAGIYLKRQRKH